MMGLAMMRVVQSYMIATYLGNDANLLTAGFARIILKLTGQSDSFPQLDQPQADIRSRAPFMTELPLSGRRRCTWLVAGLAMLLAAMGGCSKTGKFAPVGGSDIPANKMNLRRNVDLARAEQRAVDYFVETVGVLEPEGQTDIAAGVSGVVDEVLFREGDFVTPDDILVKVDQKRYTAAVEVARANVKRADANIAKAQDAAARMRLSGGGASDEERARTALDLQLFQAERESAQASLVLAEHNLNRSRLRAPYPGRIDQRRVTPGSFIEDKTPIATIADLSRLRLLGWVPETAAATVRQLMNQRGQRMKAIRLSAPVGGWLAGPWNGMACASMTQPDLNVPLVVCANLARPLPAALLASSFLLRKDLLPGGDSLPSGYDPEFVLAALPQRTFRGRIFYLSSVADKDTHMFECKAEIDTRGLGVELKPGYTARIRYPMRSNSDACVVPEESVRASEQGFVAFVPVKRLGRDGQPEWIARGRLLELGYRAPGWVEVRRGIRPGEWLVRRGAEALEDGTPIRFPEDQLGSLVDSR
jgi:multidrug efflux pump subunit AcrA (membrane-fusion protein)